MYNIEVEGDHCYRVGQQGLLVHNASAAFENHEAGESDFDRNCLNQHNVVAYFDAVPAGQRVLHIAAGPNGLPGALTEDVDVWSGKTRLSIKPSLGDSPATFTFGRLFDKVVVVNASNKGISGQTGFLWVFQDAPSVMRSGAELIVAGGAVPGQSGDPSEWNQHPFIGWVKGHEDEILALGFEKVTGLVLAPLAIRQLPATGLNIAGVLVQGTNEAAVSVTFKRK